MAIDNNSLVQFYLVESLDTIDNKKAGSFYVDQNSGRTILSTGDKELIINNSIPENDRRYMPQVYTLIHNENTSYDDAFSSALKKNSKIVCQSNVEYNFDNDILVPQSTNERQYIHIDGNNAKFNKFNLNFTNNEIDCNIIFENCWFDAFHKLINDSRVLYTNCHFSDTDINTLTNNVLFYDLKCKLDNCQIGSCALDTEILKQNKTSVKNTYDLSLLETSRPNLGRDISTGYPIGSDNRNFKYYIYLFSTSSETTSLLMATIHLTNAGTPISFSKIADFGQGYSVRIIKEEIPTDPDLPSIWSETAYYTNIFTPKTAYLEWEDNADRCTFILKLGNQVIDSIIMPWADVAKDKYYDVNPELYESYGVRLTLDNALVRMDEKSGLRTYGKIMKDIISNDFRPDVSEDESLDNYTIKIKLNIQTELMTNHDLGLWKNNDSSGITLFKTSVPQEGSIMKIAASQKFLITNTVKNIYNQTMGFAKYQDKVGFVWLRDKDKNDAVNGWLSHEFYGNDKVMLSLNSTENPYLLDATATNTKTITLSKYDTTFEDLNDELQDIVEILQDLIASNFTITKWYATIEGVQKTLEELAGNTTSSKIYTAFGNKNEIILTADIGQVDIIPDNSVQFTIALNSRDHLASNATHLGVWNTTEKRNTYMDSDYTQSSGLVIPKNSYFNAMYYVEPNKHREGVAYVEWKPTESQMLTSWLWVKNSKTGQFFTELEQHSIGYGKGPNEKQMYSLKKKDETDNTIYKINSDFNLEAVKFVLPKDESNNVNVQELLTALSEYGIDNVETLKNTGYIYQEASRPDIQISLLDPNYKIVDWRIGETSIYNNENATINVGNVNEVVITAVIGERLTESAGE